MLSQDFGHFDFVLAQLAVTTAMLQVLTYFEVSRHDQASYTLAG